MRRLFILMIIPSIFLLNGCATWLLPPPEKTILRSEIENIPKAYELPAVNPKYAYNFEVIIHSQPEGAEVWSAYNEPKKIGNTPLAIPCIYEVRLTWSNCYTNYYPEKYIEKKYFPDIKRYEVWFKNIFIKKNDYFIFYIKHPLYEETSVLDPNIVSPLPYFHNRSIEINCALVMPPDKFDGEIKKLTDNKKFKVAERLRNERIVKLKELIESGGLQEEYVKELKRLKEMGNLAESEMAKPKEDLDSEIAKLKENLDKAIKAGDYDKANKIKELIEYKEKGSFGESTKRIDEKAIKLNNEGLAYARQKYYNDALNSFKKAIEADPVYVDPYLNLSYCYIYLGNVQEAINYAEKALKLKPDSPLAFYYMGIAYDVLGNHSLAIEKYKKALVECATGECNDEFIVRIKKEGIEGGLFNSMQAAKTRASQSSSSQGIDFGDLLLGALLIGSSIDSGK